MKKFLILLIAAALLLTGCKKEIDQVNISSGSDIGAVSQSGSKKLNEPDVPTEPAVETAAPTEPSIDELVEQKYEKILSAPVKGSAELKNISALNQLDGMEAGCEAMALTAAINYFGYELGIDDIVDDYLVYSDSFVTGYCGDPHYFYEGAGVFPPGIVTTAWNFVEDKKAEFYPLDTTGLSLDELYRLLDNGCPVLVWTTYDRNEPEFNFSETYNGIEYPWYDSEHCVCLCGYDKNKGLVKVADSWGGYEDWESAEWFEYLYDEIGRFSVALMGTDDLTGDKEG